MGPRDQRVVSKREAGGLHPVFLWSTMPPCLPLQGAAMGPGLALHPPTAGPRGKSFEVGVWAWEAVKLGTLRDIRITAARRERAA